MTDKEQTLVARLLEIEGERKQLIAERTRLIDRIDERDARIAELERVGRELRSIISDCARHGQIFVASAYDRETECPVGCFYVPSEMLAEIDAALPTPPAEGQTATQPNKENE